MKRLNVCLVSFFSLGAIGPCTGSPPDETDITPSNIPELPPIPPFLFEPEPILTEPELKTWTCDEFPPLPLGSASSREIIRILTSNEATHFWKSLSCPSSSFNELGEISGCKRLLAGTFTNARDKYSSVFRFSLTDLPTADKVENVTLNLYPLQGSVFFDVTLSLDSRALAADWWRECSDETEIWRPLCDDETPATRIDEAIDWQLGEDELGYYLLSLEFTELYRHWQIGTQPNHGLMIHSIAGLFNFFIFAGPDHPDSSYRPYLKFTVKAVNPTLRFPLAGVYDQSRITGYDFGDWWLDKRCDGTDKPPSPRLRHTGVDFRAAPGDKVYAIHDGAVVYASRSNEWGGYVVLEHGSEKKWTSTCTHVLPTVAVGDQVNRGDQIATIAYGNANFNPHLHFQVLWGTPERKLSLIGRLPDEKSCYISKSPFLPDPDPPFPNTFVDPKCLDWE